MSTPSDEQPSKPPNQPDHQDNDNLTNQAHHQEPATPPAVETAEDRAEEVRGQGAMAQSGDHNQRQRANPPKNRNQVDKLDHTGRSTQRKNSNQNSNRRQGDQMDNANSANRAIAPQAPLQPVFNPQQQVNQHGQLVSYIPPNQQQMVPFDLANYQGYPVQQNMMNQPRHRDQQNKGSHHKKPHSHRSKSCFQLPRPNQMFDQQLHQGPMYQQQHFNQSIQVGFPPMTSTPIPGFQPTQWIPTNTNTMIPPPQWVPQNQQMMPSVYPHAGVQSVARNWTSYPPPPQGMTPFAYQHPPPSLPVQHVSRQQQMSMPQQSSSSRRSSSLQSSGIRSFLHVDITSNCNNGEDNCAHKAPWKEVNKQILRCNERNLEGFDIYTGKTLHPSRRRCSVLPKDPTTTLKHALGLMRTEKVENDQRENGSQNSPSTSNEAGTSSARSSASSDDDSIVAQFGDCLGESHLVTTTKEDLNHHLKNNCTICKSMENIRIGEILKTGTSSVALVRRGSSNLYSFKIVNDESHMGFAMKTLLVDGLIDDPCICQRHQKTALFVLTYNGVYEIPGFLCPALRGKHYGSLDRSKRGLYHPNNKAFKVLPQFAELFPDQDEVDLFVTEEDLEFYRKNSSANWIHPLVPHGAKPTLKLDGQGKVFPGPVMEKLNEAEEYRSQLSEALKERKLKSEKWWADREQVAEVVQDLRDTGHYTKKGIQLAAVGLAEPGLEAQLEREEEDAILEKLLAKVGEIQECFSGNKRSPKVNQVALPNPIAGTVKEEVAVKNAGTDGTLKTTDSANAFVIDIRPPSAQSASIDSVCLLPEDISSDGSMETLRAPLSPSAPPLSPSLPPPSPTPSIIAELLEEDSSSETEEVAPRSPEGIVHNVPSNPAVPMENVPSNAVVPVANVSSNPAIPMENIPSNPAVPVENVSSNPAVPMENVSSNPAVLSESDPRSPAVPVGNVPSSSAVPVENIPSSPTVPVENVPSSPAILVENIPSTPAVFVENVPSNPAFPVENVNRSPAVLVENRSRNTAALSESDPRSPGFSETSNTTETTSAGSELAQSSTEFSEDNGSNNSSPPNQTSATSTPELAALTIDSSEDVLPAGTPGTSSPPTVTTHFQWGSVGEYKPPDVMTVTSSISSQPDATPASARKWKSKKGEQFRRTNKKDPRPFTISKMDTNLY